MMMRSSLDQQMRCNTVFLNHSCIYAPITKYTDNVDFHKLTFDVFIKQCVTGVINEFCKLCAVPSGYMNVSFVYFFHTIYQQNMYIVLL